MDLKDTWKDVGKGLGFAFRDLGKAVIKSAKTGIDEVDKWASGNNRKPDGELPEGEIPEIAEGEASATPELSEEETAEAEVENIVETEEPAAEQVNKPRFVHDNTDDD